MTTTTRGRVRTETLLTLMAMTAAVWFFNGGGQNQNATFDLSRSLVETGSIKIDDYRDNTVDLSFNDGHYYVNKAPGLSWIAAPLYALTLPLKSLDLSSGLTLTLSQYLATALINGLSLAGIALLVFLFGRRFDVDPAWAATVALLITLGTPLLPYSSMLFAHLPSAALYLGAIFLVTGQRSRPVIAGLVASVAGSMNYLLIPLALLPAIVVAWRTRSARTTLLYLAGATPFAVLTMIYHAAAFGSPFVTAVAKTNPEFISEGAAMGVLQAPSLAALWGITFSPYRGLFFLSPFLVVGLIGLFRLGRRDKPLLAVVVITILGFVLFNISFNGWHGGYTIGPRYIIPIIPLLGLGLLLTQSRALRLVVIGLGVVSVFVNLAVTAVDPQVPETLRNPVLDYSLPTLFAGHPPANENAPWLADFFTGHVGVNRLTVSERQIFRKFPPGSPETEWASFNLGEPLTQPGSIWSLLPLLIIELTLGWLLWRSLERTPADRPPSLLIE